MITMLFVALLAVVAVFAITEHNKGETHFFLLFALILFLTLGFAAITKGW